MYTLILSFALHVGQITAVFTVLILLASLSIGSSAFISTTAAFPNFSVGK
ncbi:hypothetical protein [Paenisporosarcina sp.]